ncbi:hypothetical protein ACS5NO_09230 [Larkinella sp. GY13]|uniref:hypothetical protein n=1 Tax=Larkinella sp. GY13 TaxID=3453720 RepID=UPI003EEDED49
MKIKRIAIFVLIISASYGLFRINQVACKTCENNNIQVINSCAPVRSAYKAVYRCLNCFCDIHQDWKKISELIRRIDYFRGGVTGEIYPTSIVGIKKIACSDDELQYDVFDDDEVFLYIDQDTSKNIYDGALKAMSINNMMANYIIGALDVGKENRTLIHNSEKATVRYNLDYSELNSKSLIKFQQAIHYDSSYQKKFKNVEYQLVNKETRRYDASIRYEDFGERFYLDVF